MSMTSKLWDDGDELAAWCPVCGSIVNVYDSDRVTHASYEYPEYYVTCPECGQTFYASESPDY